MAGVMLYDIPQSSTETPGLEDYLRAIRERWQLILMGALLGMLAALAFDNARVDTFEAEAKVVINPTIANATNNNLVQPVLEREREVMASIAVVEQALVDGALSGTATRIIKDLDVAFVNDSDTLSVSYQSTEPATAAAMVNAIGQAYVDRREDASLAVYNTQIESLQAQATQLEERLEESSTELGAAQARRTQAIARPTTDVSRAGLIEEATETVSALTSARTVATNDLSAVNRELRALDTELAARAATAEVIQSALPPENPTGVSRGLLVAAGLVLGAILGAVLAFTLQRLDRTAKGSAEVEAALGTNVLGSIPTYGVGNRRAGILMLSNARTARVQRVRESYRRLRASMSFLQTTQESTSFIITSARPAEGKSSTAANVAVAAAQAGAKVVLVSADLRRPMQEAMFGIQTEVGLSDYLNDPNVTNILVPVPDVPGLVLVPSGPLPTNPGELLSSAKFRELISDLEGQFDLVIVDMPPVLSTADAGSAAPLVDGVIVVVDSQRTDTTELLRVRTSLERAGGSIAGAVLNKDRSDDGVSLRKGRYSYEKVASRT
jgi:non-specific protein-tyrosine kinase